MTKINLLIAVSVVALVAIIAHDNRQDTYPALKPMRSVSDGFWVEVGEGEARHNCLVGYRLEAKYKVLKYEDENLHIQYTSIYAPSTALGTDCPDRTEFQISRDEWAQKMIAREKYLRYRLKIEALAQWARNRGEAAMGAVDIDTPDGAWVTVANWGGIKNSRGMNTNFGGRCVLPELTHGAFKVVAGGRGKYVVRYNGIGGEGTKCPDGTLFFAVEK